MKKVSVNRLFIMIVLYSLVANFAHPITPTFIQNLHLHNYMFGVAFACMATTNFLFSPFWGKVSKSIGSAKVVGICFFGYAFAQFLFGTSTTELNIIVARLVGGFFISGITVCNILYVMDNSAEDKKGENLATSVTLSAIFSAFGYMIGGFLGDRSISLTFTCQVIGLAFIGMLYLLTLADGNISESFDAKELIKNSNPFKAIIDSRQILSAMVVCFLVMCVCTSFASTCYEQCFNYFIKDQFGFPPSYNGLLKAAVGIITMIANATICVALMKKTNIVKSIIPVLLICFMMMISIIVLDSVIPFIIMNVIFFGFNAVYQPLQQAMINIFTKGKDNGLMVGAYNSMKSLGMVMGSLFAGFIYEVGPKLSFVSSAIAFLLAVIFAYLTYRNSKGELQNGD
ncbi:MAG: MFS transporter [Firmicutes bacterium]|nr:MFS transporter [Erysipelotrichaceae bacterium]MDD7226987.1 MFS transporter [Bacillota bacterium]